MSLSQELADLMKVQIDTFEQGVVCVHLAKMSTDKELKEQAQSQYNQAKSQLFYTIDLAAKEIDNNQRMNDRAIELLNTLKRDLETAIQNARP